MTRDTDKTLHVNLDADDAEAFEAVKDALDAGSDAAATRELIRDAYDSLPTGGHWYAPADDASRRRLDTDTRKEVFRRYDAPAVHPDDIDVWPRNQTKKGRVLAAICRFEGIDANLDLIESDEDELETAAEEVKDVIRETIGEGTDGRNLEIYPEMVLNRLVARPPEEADNLPAVWHFDGVESIDDYVDRADNLLAADAAADAYWTRAARGRQILSRMAGVDDADTPAEELDGDAARVRRKVEELEEAARDA